MDARDVRAFVERDWQRLEATKAAYWAERFRQNWRSTWDAAQALLDHARRVRNPFQTDAEREEDFNAHAALRARIDRATHAFTRR